MASPAASPEEDAEHLLADSTIMDGHVLEQRQRQVAMGIDAVLGGFCVALGCTVVAEPGARRPANKEE